MSQHLLSQALKTAAVLKQQGGGPGRNVTGLGSTRYQGTLDGAESM